MFRALKSIDDVKREVRRVVARQKPGSRDDVSRYQAEIEELLGACPEFLPEWREVPCVCRVARIRVDDSFRIDPFVDNVVLPDVKHTLELVIEMLNYIRDQRGFPKVRMPIFLQPDEVGFELWRRADSGGGFGTVALFSHAPEQRGPRHATPRHSRKGEQSLRRAVLERDERKCTRCGARKDLQLRALEGADDENDPGAYATLCRRCYLQAEGAAIAAPGENDGFEDEQPSLPQVAIRSQLALVFQKGAMNWIGFVFGRSYVLLKS